MLGATEIVCCVFLLIQMIATVLKKDLAVKSSRALFYTSVVLFISCLCEGIVLLADISSYPLPVTFVLLLVSHIGGALSLISYMNYCYQYIRERTKMNRLFYLVPMAVTFAFVVFMVVSAFRGKLHSISNGVVIESDWLQFPILVSFLLLMVYLSIVAFTKRRVLGKRAVLFLGIFGLLPIAATLVSIANSIPDYTLPASAVALILVYMMMEDRVAYEKSMDMNLQLQKSQKELQQRFDIIQSMSNVYFASYYIDLKKDTYTELNSLDSIREVIDSNGQAQRSLFLACEKLISPESRDVMKSFVDLSTIQERLKDKKVISQRYVGITTGWSLCYLIAGDRDKNGNIRHLFYACRTIHDEKAKEEAHKKKVEEYNAIISNAGLGVWYIYLKDGKAPRMQVSDKMRELLGITRNDLTEEEIYSWWWDRVDPAAVPLVEESVQIILKNHFNEITYLWNHPVLGEIYVRCGGTSKFLEDGTAVLSGYHADVTHIVEQETFRRRTVELEENQKRMNRMNISLMGALGTVVEFRSLESGDHVKRVMKFTKIMLRKVMENYPDYCLTEEKIDLMAQAAALHDVGKIAIPDDILKAPRRLTPEEFSEMKKHTTYGCDILERFNFVENNEIYKYCYDICRWHHERADGRGYPDGLTENQIPIYCQATAVADCFDALVSRRVYKDAETCDNAFQMIMDGECGTFSEKVLKCFELARGELFATVAENQ